MSTKRKTALSILITARKLITPEGVWIKGHYAEDKDGAPVGYKSQKAACFCSQGAIYRAAGNARRTADIANYELSKAIGQTVVFFNDRGDTTHSAVLAAFDRAIASLRREKRAA